MSSEDVKRITLKKFPLILRKKIIKPVNIVSSFKNSIQEDIIYTSKPGDFMSGEVRNMTIVNRLNVFSQSSTTIAKCESHSGELYEKTSEAVSKLIGQNNYDVLFTSLCSLFSQELKIRSIYSLLTVPKKNNSVTCQTTSVGIKNNLIKNLIDTECQTNDSNIEQLKRIRPKRRTKRHQLAPYVVKNSPEPKQPRRIVIPPENFEMILIKEDTLKTESQTTDNPVIPLPVLESVFDDDSNNSIGRFSSLSIKTTKDLMTNPLNMIIDKHTRNISDDVHKTDVDPTEQCKYQNLDSPTASCVSLDNAFGVKDPFSKLSPEERVKLLIRQGLHDWKYCLTQYNNGHLPIHIAVQSNDVDLLKRQCLALKMRGISVDVTADGLTPLKMSLFQENTQLLALLLDFGADPLDTDDDDRNAFHIAAELSTDHLQILVNYCQQNARKLLGENEELWRPGYECKSDEELSRILLRHVNQAYDNQGYTPLMLASKLGKYNNVMALVESCKDTVNIKMPSSGNTALYIAIRAACMDCTERGNKSKVVDHYSKTVEILIENGADPSIENFAGSSINDLLTEISIAELSMLIANKITSIRLFDGQLPKGIKSSDLMLIKDNEGEVNIKEVKEKKTNTLSPANVTKYPPVILENVTYKPPVKAGNSKATSTLPGQSLKQPVKDENTGNVVKNENVNVSQSYTPIVKNFKLNKPILIKSKVTNNKRKLDMVLETGQSKKRNSTD